MSANARRRVDRSLEMWQVITAILYIVVGGIQWRMLPKEYPKWQSVYTYFRHWRSYDTWQRIHDTLRAKVRCKEGRHKHPTVGSIGQSDRQDEDNAEWRSWL